VPRVLDTTPTAAIYWIHGAQETRAERLPARDVDSLIGALLHHGVSPTNVSPVHGRLVGAVDRSLVDAIAWACNVWLAAETKLIEPTPSAIEQSRARTAAVSPEPASNPPAYEAFKALGRWLAADDATIADVVGVGRTTPYAWKRDGREPRAATTQRIYEYHATIDSLRRRLGIGGLRRWLHDGVPSRRDRLLAGNLEQLEAEVHAVLFEREPTHRIDLAAAPEAPSALAETGVEESALQPSRRRPRRSGG
jgi:hypothetical protein